MQNMNYAWTIVFISRNVDINSRYAISTILDCTVRVAVIVKALFVLIHSTETHTHA